MARFSGKIGYATTSETSPGVWTESMIERQYYGDIVKHFRKWSTPPGGGINDNLVFSQDVSVLADPYLFDNLNNMRYVVYRGIPWKIESINIDRPRVTITLGGEWNGVTADTSQSTSDNS